VANPKISEDDCRRILSLFEMTQRASQEGADAHTKNEGANAVSLLLRLFAKYGLNLGDLPEIQRQHEQNEAAKTMKTASGRATSNRHQPNVNVLELIHHVLQSYVDIQPHEYIGVALWVLHSHAFNHFQIAPRLAALSPVRGCGKTKLLMLLERLVANPERHDNITAASIYRIIERDAPTLLLDEGDNLGLRIDRVMRSVLNSGHLRGGAITRVIRGEPKAFATFAPAAIGAIGTLTLPLLHRSVVIQMHRTLRTDLKTIEMMRSPEETKRLEALRRHIVAWAQATTQFDHDPKLPKILRGRAADNWRVLISVVDSFESAYWSEAARHAAIAFNNGFFDEDACVSLLYDIRTVFRELRIDRIKSSVLAEVLHELEEGAGIWNAYRGEADDQAPHPITQGEIAALLRRFDRDLRPRPLFELGSRETRGKAGRGYYCHQFEKWWAIYCSEEMSEQPNNLHQLRMEAK
jgi:hypothetical protein